MRALLISVAILVAQFATAQERFGIAHSNYAGGDGAYLNPARAAGQWPYLDIRLAGADLFLWNSLVAWSGRENALVGEVRQGALGQVNGNVVLRDRSHRRTHQANVLSNALGPGFSLSVGRGTIGLGMRSRAHVSVSGVSREMSNFLYGGLNYQPQRGERVHDEGIRVLGAAWSEFGLNYAHILNAEGFGMLSAGVHMRYLIGHAAAAVQVTDLDYTVVDSSELLVQNISARYGLASPAANAGRGFGMDLGMTYERTLEEVDGYKPHKRNSCDPAAYRYRIGVSLLDLGGIRYRNAEGGSISSGSYTIADHSNVPVSDREDLDSLLGTSSGWSRSQGLSLGMPTALAVQFDQRVAKHTYLAFAAVQQLSGKRTLRLRRSNSMAITPRFETRYFEAGIPVVFHEYDLLRPSVGLMLRFQGLVIGSDHLLPFISKGDVHALDAYIRVRWMFYRSPACKGRSKRANTAYKGRKEMVPCAAPKF